MPANPMQDPDRKPLGLISGIGMVVANMIGAGVFLSTGFMAQDLSAGWILLAWAIGTLLALAGAQAYAAVAERVPRSGGEYRYLSTLLHPALGYLAGWASLLVGFSAPIAIDALAAGAFARTLMADINPVLVAALLIAALTVLHAVGLRASIWTQNALVVFKGLLVIGFLCLGLFAGHNAWPAWRPPHESDGFPLAAFMGSLFYIAYAFSGWNAAAYAAGEFREPRRNVPRAMLIGCLAVGVLYWLINWIFVANLTPERASVVFRYETARITLGHLVTRDLIGETGADLMSVLLIMAFVSAMSAMIFMGPRIYAAMARDGFLPKILAGRAGRPPVGAVILQGALALGLVVAYPLQEVLKNVGAILVLFSALVAFSLLLHAGRSPRSARPPTLSLAAALVYVLSAVWMLYFGFRDSPGLLLWLSGATLAALAAYFTSRRRGKGSSKS